MKIGYARVSTPQQSLTRQRELLLAFGCERIFEENISGIDTARPQLKAMLKYIREGDTVVIESYSRLARSTKDLLMLVETFEKKGVPFISLKEQIDTSTPQGKLMMTIFAGLVQFEREQTLQRQREGIELAKAHDAELKAQGKPPEHYKGRKKIAVSAEEFKAACEPWLAGKQTARATMAKLGVKPNTFYRRAKELGIKSAIADNTILNPLE